VRPETISSENAALVLHRLVESELLGIFYWRVDGGIQDANDAFLRMIGYTRDDLVAGRVNWQEATPPEHRARDAEAMRALHETGVSPRREKEYFHKDGSRVPVIIAGVALDNPCTHGVAFAIDLSDQRRAADALRTSEERLRTLVEGVSDYALFTTDAVGVITSWNPGFRRVLGWEKEEIVGQPIHVIFTPEDRAAGAPEQEMKTAAREGRASDERWHLKKDGSRFWATGVVQPVWDGAGAVVGFSKVLTDATARHETERLLSQKAALIDLASDAIFVHDPQSNQITFWNQGAERLYGWSREEAVGSAVHDLLGTEFPDGVTFTAVRAELERSGHWEGDLTHTRRDGSRIVVASKWALQREQDGGLPGGAVLEVNRDVTVERARQNAQREDAARQRELAETLQRSLLLVPPPDAFPGVTVKPLYQSADDDALMGGDFFDVMAVDEDVIAISVGDCTGKGIQSATRTAEVKFALRAFLRQHPLPAAALSRLNDFLAERDRLDPLHMGGSYVALVLCVLNTRTGEIVCSAAGIDPPFIVRSGTSETVELEQGGGPLLGVMPGGEYTDQRDTLLEGDVLAMSTDGITEARHGSGTIREFFGYDGLVRAVREELVENPLSLYEVGQAVVSRARRFAGGAINDDVCLLLARRR
jgi:PAS domain S-box-containing protein